MTKNRPAAASASVGVDDGASHLELGVNGGPEQAARSQKAEAALEAVVAAGVAAVTAFVGWDALAGALAAERGDLAGRTNVAIRAVVGRTAGSEAEGIALGAYAMGMHMQLEAAGPDGACPTCSRPLKEEYQGVLGTLSRQLEEIVYSLFAWDLGVRISGSDLFPKPFEVARGIVELVHRVDEPSDSVGGAHVPSILRMRITLLVPRPLQHTRVPDASEVVAVR